MACRERTAHSRIGRRPSRSCGRIRSCKISSLTFHRATARFICRGEIGRQALLRRANRECCRGGADKRQARRKDLRPYRPSRRLSIAEVAEILSGVVGREFKYVDVPEDAAREGMLQAGVPKWQVEALMELHAINKRNRWSAVTPDVEKVTGYSPNRFPAICA